jgi:glyoxylase-like metal-dependent hydrolase (beta-lactamase superfamily II)
MVLMNEDATGVWPGGTTSRQAFCVLADNPDPMTFRGTNTWIVADDGGRSCLVIDPGPRSFSHVERVRAACSSRGLDIVGIALTHSHADHSGAAEIMRAGRNIPICSLSGMALEEIQDTLDGLDVPDICVLPMPGHSDDSIAFFLPEDSSIITGDLIFAQSSTTIGWPRTTLAAYLDSLRRLEVLVKSRGVKRLLTGHGPVIENPSTRIRSCIMHRYERLHHIRDTITSMGTLDKEAIVHQVYADADTRLDLAMRKNIQAQLQFLIETDDPCIRAEQSRCCLRIL